jgi:ribonuclease T2
MAQAIRPILNSPAVRSGVAGALLAALICPAAALGQAYQCRMPTDLPAARPITPDGPAVRTPITGYSLALSWSPEFCRGKERDPAQRLQCSGAAGRFGFVVHGLWPEGMGRSPEWCRAVPPPAPAILSAQLCRSPSAYLIAHEWAKHGSCMARDAASYYRVSNILADAMRYPEMDPLSRDRTLTARAFRQALAAANPGRPPASFGLSVSRGGWLREVYVCLDRRFRAARCTAQQAGPRDTAALKIWRGS